MRLLSLIAVFIFISANMQAQKKSKIELLSAKSIKSDKHIQAGARRLLGNVKFKQDSTIMECDSAYFYSDRNMFDAFSNVYLYKLGSDEIEVRSDFLRHEGDKKMAKFRENVILRDKEVILRTDSLDYNTQTDIGYYLFGGEIEDSATTLTSTKAHYFNRTSTVLFKDEVVITHNEGEYQMFTDTLRYNTNTETAHFFGPTEMVNDSNYLYAEFGWYDTKVNQALFKNNALYTRPKQSVEADSLFLDREKEFGIAYENVIATDSVEQMVVTGNYLELDGKAESVFVTDSAMVKSIFQNDTLFLHGDTIFTFMDSVYIKERDTTEMHRAFTAYRHVKMFKSDFQSKCDSLYFSMADSVLEFHGSPVLWAESSQITAEYIEGYIVNEILDRFKLYRTGLIVAMQDSIHFNQIKGREITGYFKNNELHRIDVENKSETIYFPTDDGDIIGVNKGNSQNITIYMRKNEVKRIIYRSQPKSTVYPLDDLQPKEMKMKEFNWLDDIRPKQPADIFIWGETPSKD